MGNELGSKVVKLYVILEKQIMFLHCTLSDVNFLLLITVAYQHI